MKKTILQNLTLALFIKVLASAAISLGSEGVQPISDAGLSRYAAQDPVVLDGTGSYDPDNSGTLSYAWSQIAGLPVIIIDANTATPTIVGSMQTGIGRDKSIKISGFTQTDVIQECEFELVVSDGELTSLPDTVKVIIVPDFGADTLRQENPPFDRNKPTLIYFGGGDCVTGGGSWGSTAWAEKANIISFQSYGPDSGGGAPTYYKYGDMIIVYLSSVAPDYKQPIQTLGFSTGGMPGIDVAIHLNIVYADARYAVNQVTFLDAACRGSTDTSADVADVIEYLGSVVDGEQCWIDNYDSAWFFYPGVLNAKVAEGQHIVPPRWYKDSLTNPQKNQFNGGLVAGAYWSVIGPGKNLQLAPQTDAYYFRWYGTQASGSMGFFDEGLYPGRLPQPVTLVGPSDGAIVDANGAVLSCQESENVVGYQLVFGRDPYHMVYLFSDTPSAPGESVTTFPFEQCWWTVRAYDEYGSTIHADPVDIKVESARIHKLIGNYPQGLEDLQEALTTANDINDDGASTAKVKQEIANLSWHSGDFKLCLSSGEEAYELFTRLKDLRGMRSAIADVGYAHFFLNDYDKEKECFLTQLKLAEKIGDPLLRGIALDDLGGVYNEMGDLEKSLECHLEYKDISESLNDRNHMKIAYMSLGNAYYALNSFDDSRKYYEMLHEISKEQGDRFRTGFAIMSFGNVDVAAGKYSSAIKHTEKALSMSLFRGENIGLIYILGILGKAYMYLGDYMTAEEKFKKALAYAQDLDNHRGIAHASGILGLLYSKMKRYDEAETNLQLCIKIADKYGLGGYEAIYSTELINVFIGAGNVKEAREIFARTKKYVDKLNTLNTSYQFDLIEAKLLYVEENKGEATDCLRIMAEKYISPKFKSEIYYHLFRITGSRSDKEAALDQYQEFSKTSEAILIKQRLKELA